MLALNFSSQLGDYCALGLLLMLLLLQLCRLGLVLLLLREHYLLELCNSLHSLF